MILHRLSTHVLRSIKWMFVVFFFFCLFSGIEATNKQFELILWQTNEYWQFANRYDRWTNQMAKQSIQLIVVFFSLSFYLYANLNVNRQIQQTFADANWNWRYHDRMPVHWSSPHRQRHMLAARRREWEACIRLWLEMIFHIHSCKWRCELKIIIINLPHGTWAINLNLNGKSNRFALGKCLFCI